MTTCDGIQTDGRPGLLRIMRLLLFFAVQGAAVILVGFAALFLSFEPVWSAEGPTAAFARPGDARSGSLLLKTDDGYADAARLGIDVDLTVSGPTVRARVTQIFRNPTQNWVEATYVYPLPSGGAVDTLKMVVGDRVVVGEIKERQQARIIYEQARASGQKAALTEQERPNIFTNSVANIGPGETVLVQIEYQEPVQQSGNEFSLRVPMVVGPRYNPAPLVQSVDSGRTAAAGARPNRSGAGPRPHLAEVLDPAEHAPVNPTAITVRLQAGFLGEVKSHHHQVKIESPTAPPHHQTGRRPGAGGSRLRTHLETGGREGALGRAVPRTCRRCRLSARLRHPAVGRTGPAKAIAARSDLRDRQFRLDGRHSIMQAKASLTYALGRLQPNDRFNVIRFDHTMDVLFPNSVPADRQHVGNATAFVGALRAEGGTEMIPAMRAALTDSSTDDATTFARWCS